MREDYTAYAKLPGINWGTLREMQQSPQRYHHRQTTPLDDTPSMALGRLIHTATLEPERLNEVYAVWAASGGSRRTNAYKAWAAEHADKELITEDELMTALGASLAVRSHRTARQVLRGGKVEHSLRWVDPVTHMRCKARPDHIKKNGGLTDLKSTTTVNAEDFGRLARRLGYYGQMAFYRRAARHNGYPDGPVRIIAVEQKPPFEVAVFRLDEDLLAAGDRLVSRLLADVYKWRKRGRWPARYEEEVALQMWIPDELMTDEIEVLS